MILVLVLSACGGVAGGSWSGVSRSQDGETIYVAHNKTVVALDAVSGDVVWTYPDEENRDTQFFAVPVADNGSVYVGDYQGRLHAIDASDGSQEWLFAPERETLIGPLSVDPTDRVYSGVALSPDYAFFGLGSRNVVAVERATAKEVWTFETDHGVWGTPLYLPADNAPGGTAVLLAASLDHYLYALDPATGNEIWDVDLGGAVPGDITYDAERQWVYLGTFASQVVAVDLVNQVVVATFDADDWVWSNPALDDDTLYFGDLGGTVYAVNVTDSGFAQAWRALVSEEGAVRSTPLVTDALVVVGSRDGYLYALDREDGSDVWDEAVEGSVLTRLVRVATGDTEGDGLVVAGTNNNDELIVALNVETGNKDWDYSED